MKRSMNAIRSLLGLLALVALGLGLVMLFRGVQPATNARSPLPTPSTVMESPLPTPTLIPPTASPEPTPVVLPPLPPYPTPGPFKEMRLLYTSSQLPGYRSIKADGTDEVMLAPWPSGPRSQLNAAGLLVALNGERILYTYWDNMNQKQAVIWTMNPDGSDKRLLVAATEDWFPEDAIWSPDGKQIAYQRAYLAGSYSEGAPVRTRDLWIMDADGGNQRLVLDDPALDSIEAFGGSAVMFRWLRNGYIYFVNHDRNLFAVNPQNGDLFRLMDNVDALNVRRSLSPGGTHMATSQDIPADAIYRSGLTPVEINGDIIRWSLDAKRLIYGTPSDGTWIRDLATNHERLLIPYTDGMSIQALDLSADSKLLAYQSDEGLFVMEIESGKAELIVKDPRDSKTGGWTIRFVSWLPVP